MIQPNLIIIQLQIQVVQFNQITNYLMPNMESKWEYPMGDVTMPKLVWMWIGMKIRWTIHALIPQPLLFLMRLWNLYYIVIMYQKTFYQVRTKKLQINIFSFLRFKNSISFQNIIVWTKRLIIKSFYLPMATTVLYGQNMGNTGQLMGEALFVIFTFDTHIF